MKDSHNNKEVFKALTVREAIGIVLGELNERLPKTNKDGFLAETEVYEAMNRLIKHIK